MISDKFMNRAVEISVGSLSPTINWTTLKLEQFDLPPLDQQRRIAEILWAIDRDLSEIKRRHEVAKVLRSSLLSESIGTHLQNGFKLQNVQDLIDAGVIDPPQDGNHGELHPTSKDYVSDGIPFIMANDIRLGHLCLDTCKRIPLSLAQGLRIGFSLPGDVLLTHKGSAGLTTIVPSLQEPYVMLTPQVTYYRVRDPNRLRPTFLKAIFESAEFQRIFKNRAKQSTRDYIGILAQRDLPIFVPNVSEQDSVLCKLQQLDSAMVSGETQLSELSSMAVSLINALC